jgi:uncharacterized protein YuzE
MDLRVEYSRAEDAAYIYLRTVEPGGAVRQEIVGGAAEGNVILDFDADGRLVGIEVLDASRFLPTNVIAAADSIDGVPPSGSSA